MQVLGEINILSGKLLRINPFGNTGLQELLMLMVGLLFTQEDNCLQNISALM
jgi:hypothetical protein